MESVSIARAHAGLSRLAMALEASRTIRVQMLDLVAAAQELRRIKDSGRSLTAVTQGFLQKAVQSFSMPIPGTEGPARRKFAGAASS
jgi:hypothetical protein